MKTTVTKVKKVTYMDDPCRVWEVKVDSKRCGKRVVITHNLKNDHVELKVVVGDGRTVNFKCYAIREVLPPIVDANVTKYAVTLAHEFFNRG